MGETKAKWYLNHSVYKQGKRDQREANAVMAEALVAFDEEQLHHVVEKYLERALEQWEHGGETKQEKIEMLHNSLVDRLAMIQGHVRSAIAAMIRRG